MKIRKAGSPEDWRRIREICALTGKSGEPVERERFEFFGERWIGPYQRLLPDWTYVAESPAGPVAGYLTGCPRTAAFERARFLRWALPTAVKLALGAYPRNEDTRSFLRRTFRRALAPEGHFSTGLRAELRRAYPAHLHMNLDAAYRGAGAGRRLVDAFALDLRRTGSSGIHVFCGPRPVPFYAKVGFVELESLELSPGVRVFALGRRL